MSVNMTHTGLLGSTGANRLPPELRSTDDGVRLPNEGGRGTVDGVGAWGALVVPLLPPAVAPEEDGAAHQEAHTDGQHDRQCAGRASAADRRIPIDEKCVHTRRSREYAVGYRP